MKRSKPLGVQFRKKRKDKVERTQKYRGICFYGDFYKRESAAGFPDGF